MPLQQRQATITWEGDLKGKGRIRSGTGAFPEMPVTFSARTENANGMTSPEELLAAAHATCYAMAFSNTLAKAGSPPQVLNVQAVCSLERTESGLKISMMDLNVRGKVPGLDQAKFQQLAEQGEKNCPVSNALRNNVTVNVHATLE